MKVQTETPGRPNVVLTLTWEEALCLYRFVRDHDTKSESATLYRVPGSDVSIDMRLFLALDEVNLESE